MVKTTRCAWCGEDPLYVPYHDLAWGVSTRERSALFELLALEGMQAGLSWIPVLRKHRHLRGLFLHFVLRPSLERVRLMRHVCSRIRA